MFNYLGLYHQYLFSAFELFVKSWCRKKQGVLGANVWPQFVSRQTQWLSGPWWVVATRWGLCDNGADVPHLGMLMLDPHALWSWAICHFMLCPNSVCCVLRSMMINKLDNTIYFTTICSFTALDSCHRSRGLAMALGHRVVGAPQVMLDASGRKGPLNGHLKTAALASWQVPFKPANVTGFGAMMRNAMRFRHHFVASDVAYNAAAPWDAGVGCASINRCQEYS